MRWDRRQVSLDMNASWQRARVVNGSLMIGTTLLGVSLEENGLENLVHT
jgi:hypothetical protein